MLNTGTLSPLLLSLLSWILLPTLTYAQCNPDGNPFGGGDGSIGTPFQICSAAQMNRVGLASMSNHYSLQSDISMSSITSYNIPGTSFGTAFTGSFNGNGYSIYDFSLTGTQDGLGLFGFTNGASFQNVSLENVSVNGTNTGNQYSVAGFVAYGVNVTLSGIEVSGSVTTTNADNVALVLGYVYGSGSSISNCYAYGSLSGRDSIGGIIGSLQDGTITRSTAEVTINARQKLGSIAGEARHGSQEPLVSECIGFGSITVGIGRAAGLVGYCESCQISDSYAGTNILGSATTVGGAIAQSDDDSLGGGANSELNRIFSYGSVAGNSNVGGAVGLVADTNSSNIFWDSEASGNGSSALGTALTTSNAQQESSFTGFDFTNTWEIDEGNSYPTLRNNPVWSSPTSSQTPSPSASATPSISPSMTPSASISSSPSASPSVSASPNSSVTPSASESASPSVSSTVTPEETPSMSPSPSPTAPSSDNYKDDLKTIGKDLLNSQEGRAQAKQVFEEIIDFTSHVISAKPSNKKARKLKRRMRIDLKKSNRLIGDNSTELTKKVAIRVKKLLKRLLKRLGRFEKISD